MKNEVIDINTDQLDYMALKYFNKMCGYTRNVEDNLQEEGMRCLDTLKEHLHIKALVSYYSSPVIQERDLRVDDVTLTCTVLEQIEKDAVIGAYFYVITIGEINIVSKDLLEQYYYNIWETAYLDAAREYLKKLLKDKNDFLMESLGPGYYGMDIASLEKFFHLLDTSLIQVYLRENKMITPMKSNIGVFLKTKIEIHLQKACETCLGSNSGCNFCNKLSRF